MIEIANIVLYTHTWEARMHNILGLTTEVEKKSFLSSWINKWMAFCFRSYFFQIDIGVRLFSAILMILVILTPYTFTLQSFLHVCICHVLMPRCVHFYGFAQCTITTKWFHIWICLFVCWLVGFPFLVVKYSNHKRNIIYRWLSCTEHTVIIGLRFIYLSISTCRRYTYNVHFDGPVLDLNG